MGSASGGKIVEAQSSESDGSVGKQLERSQSPAVDIYDDAAFISSETDKWKFPEGFIAFERKLFS